MTGQNSQQRPGYETEPSTTKYGPQGLSPSTSEPTTTDSITETPDADRLPVAAVETLAVTVKYHRNEPPLRYDVVVAYGDHEWLPIVTHAEVAHQIDGSNQYDPMGTDDWATVPDSVRQRVVDVVDDVSHPSDLSYPAKSEA